MVGGSSPTLTISFCPSSAVLLLVDIAAAPQVAANADAAATTDEEDPRYQPNEADLIEERAESCRRRRN